MAKYIQIKTDERYCELLPLIKELVFEITKKLGLANVPTKIPSSGGVAESRGGHFPSHLELNTKKAYGYRNTRNTDCTIKCRILRSSYTRLLEARHLPLIPFK